VHFCRLGSQDVVRHRLVSDIVDAYGRWDANRAQDARQGRGAGGSGSQSRRGRR
jgi:phosphate starvation-inducible PhoH-like protein